MTDKPLEYRMTLTSSPKEISRVEGFLTTVNLSAGLDEMDFNKVMVSVTEAVNNAIIHGNKSMDGKEVSVRAEVLPQWLVIEVRDQGVGFNPEAVRNPLDNENLLRESGRGVFLMRSLMDRVEFAMTKHGAQVQMWIARKR